MAMIFYQCSACFPSTHCELMVDTPTEFTPVCPAKKENSNWLHYPSEKENSFRQDLETAINSRSMENGSNTPDFILAEYLQHCLATFDLATKRRDKWYGEDENGHIMKFPKGADNGTLGPED